MKRVLSFIVCLAVIGGFYVFATKISTKIAGYEPIVTTTEPASETTIAPTSEPTVIPAVEPTAEPTVEPEPMIQPSSKMELHQINVGCANAYLVKTDTTAIVIDGGLTESRNKVINYIKDSGIVHLDAYIATHWHGDHVQNLNAILNEFGDSTTMVYGPSVNSSTKFPIPAKKGIYSQMLDGETIAIGDITIDCLGPYEIRKSGACNWDSLNFMIKFGDTRFLMTGDYVHSEKLMEEHAEEIRNVDVLQFPHHGLKCEGRLYLSDSAFSWINPQIVLVPANSSKPSRAANSRMGVNAKFYDNKSGNVVVVTDGTSISVVTEK